MFNLKGTHKTEGWTDTIWSIDIEHEEVCFTNHNMCELDDIILIDEEKEKLYKALDNIILACETEDREQIVNIAREAKEEAKNE